MVNNEMDEDQIEYEPTKRANGMRSSRISESGGFSKETTGKFDADRDSKLPSTNKVIGGSKPAPRASKPQPKSKAPTSYQENDNDIEQIKPSGTKGGYTVDFGEDAFEKPTNLKACPSCGRKFNDEALI